FEFQLFPVWIWNLFRISDFGFRIWVRGEGASRSKRRYGRAAPPLQWSILCRLILLLAIVFPATLEAADDLCTICGGPIKERLYTGTDAVTGEKKQMCQDCARLSSVCFFCSLPVKTNYTELPDGRFLCAREARTAVIE